MAIEGNDYSALVDGDGFNAKISDIDPVPWGNVRKKRNPKSFKQLRTSIKRTNGITQGVTVRIKPDDPTRLEIISGYGRLESSRLEKHEYIPAVLKVASDRQAMAMSLSENIDREALHLVDEVRAAQGYISLYDGDYELAARELGWSVKVFRGRLLLNKCSKQVLDALRQDKILLGHAEILSSYTETIQDGTLSLIIEGNWSIEYLKERTARSTRRLDAAIFDKGGCSTCPHNSEIQSSLFENCIGKAKCSNLICYKEKTDAVLEKKKETLSESYSVVLLNVEKPQEHRNTISIEVVGENQFTSGCTGCASNAVIITDGVNEDAGDVVADQCVDTACFRKMVAAHEKFLSSADQGCDSGESGTKAVTAKVKTTPAPQTSLSTKKKTTATQTVPSGVVHQSKLLLHELGNQRLKEDGHFQESLLVASLASRLDGAALTKLKDVWDAPSSFTDRALSLYALTPAALVQVKSSLFASYIAPSEGSGSEATKMVIGALNACADGISVASEGWRPSEAILNSYLLSGLLLISKKSGFTKQYDAENGKGAFSKIAKRKGDLIKILLETEFDWSSYAPDDYLKILTNK